MELDGCAHQRLYFTKRLSMTISASDDMDPVFDALANEHRREIMLALALQPRSISELAGLRDLTLPAIHKHVRVLENAAMVRRRKIGRTNFFKMTPSYSR